MSGRRVYEHLVQLRRLLRSLERANVGGLQPVQLHALEYLSRCNRYSDRPLAVAEYLGVTKGTASQTLAVLEARGLLEKIPDSSDRRVVRLRVTARGRQSLRRCAPPPPLQSAIESLPRARAEQLGAGLVELLRTLQRRNGGRSFGVCGTCRHFQREAGGRYRCGLTAEPLSAIESTQICREHEPAA